MSCKELVELVTAYLEGTLTAADRAAFEEHLTECTGCDRYLEQFRITLEVLGVLPEEKLSAASRQHLLDAFTDWKSA